MSEKTRQKKAGARADKKRQAGREDVAARRKGDTASRPKTKAGVPKATRAGRTKGKDAGLKSPTHKSFSAAELERVDRPAPGRQRSSR